MRAYIYSVVCMAAMGGIVLAVSPEGVKSGIKKHMRLICSVCILCVMISPLIELISGIKDIGGGLQGISDDGGLQDFYESIYEDSSGEGIVEAVGDAVKSQLYESFAIDYSDIRVEVELAEGNGDRFREPKKITVILSGMAIFNDPRPIEKLIRERFGCECACAIE